jgi:ATP-dependent Zn protease
MIRVTLEETGQSKTEKTEALSAELDVTEFATQIRLPTEQELLKVAYHEAGHAVLNDPTLTGERLALITVMGQGEYGGYTRYEEIRGINTSALTRQQIMARLARLLAGQLSEKRAGFEASAGWADDLKKARSLATQFLLHWGLGNNMMSVPLDGNGQPQLLGEKAGEFQKEMDRIFLQATRLAEDVLNHKWDLVKHLVKELHSKGQVTGQRFIELESQLGQKPGVTEWLSHEQPADDFVTTRPCKDFLVKKDV